MAELLTPHFGPIDYDERAVLAFPRGLPAFETETRFLLVHRDATAPVLFLQSVSTPALAFMALPAADLDPGYAPVVGKSDRELLGLSPESEPLALALLTVRGGSVTANLRAPVLLNLDAKLGAQPVPAESPYPLHFPLAAKNAERTPCS